MVREIEQKTLTAAKNITLARVCAGYNQILPYISSRHGWRQFSFIHNQTGFFLIYITHFTPCLPQSLFLSVIELCLCLSSHLSRSMFKEYHILFSLSLSFVPSPQAQKRRQAVQPEQYNS